VARFIRVFHSSGEPLPPTGIETYPLVFKAEKKALSFIRPLPIERAEEKNVITTYEVRNVLRIYGNHLKKRSIHPGESEILPYTPPDLVDISMDARRKQMLSQMSNQLISQIVPMGDERRSGERGQGTESRPALVAGAQGVI
jgi:hypothetical protein